jgi:hypothetical protein
MERTFGQPFGAVRAHVGQGEDLAELGARAAARGDDVAFAAADPDRAVVAHELTHVVQQRQAGAVAVAASRTVGAADTTAEREAEAVAAHVARHGVGAPAVAVTAAPTADVHLDRGDGPTATDNAEAGPQMVAVAFRGAVIVRVWTGPGRALGLDAARFVGRRSGGGWQWDDPIGGQVELHLQPGAKSRGVPIETWADSADTIIVDVGRGDLSAVLLDATATAQTGAVGGDGATGEGAGRGDRGARQRSDQLELGEGRADADRGGPDGVAGGAPNGAPGGTLDPRAWATGKSLRQVADQVDQLGVGGGTGAGPIAGRGAADGRTGGGTGGSGHESSWTQPETTELVPDVAKGRTPEEGGAAHGSAAGDGAKEDSGTTAAAGWLGWFNVPDNIEPAISAGAILLDADIAGFGGGLIQKLAKKALKAGKGLRHAIQSEVDAIVVRHMSTVEEEFAKLTEYQALSKAARKSKLRQASYGMERHLQRRLAREMDDRLASLRQAIAKTEELAKTDRGAAWVLQLLKEEEKAAKSVKAALKDMAPPAGAGSFAEFDDGIAGAADVGGLEDVAGVAGAEGVRAADNAADEAVRATRTHWTSSREFDGMKVYTRDDLIDPKRLDPEGRTNLQRMKKGRAPIGPDGESMHAHHLNQMDEGPVVEITKTMHQEWSSTIHINAGADIPSGIGRSEFDAWKERYWRERAKDFE